MYKVILGSGSPRRKKLLEDIGLSVEVRKKSVEEEYPDNMEVFDVPEYLASLKSTPLQDSIRKDEVLLTADTVVIHNQTILHKPKTEEEARCLLIALSGKMHYVVSGVKMYSLERSLSFSSTTKVYFNDLSEDDIHYYIQHYHPFDKAGGYGIQEWIGKIGIKKIEGDFYNVMGLPVNKVWAALKNNFG